jgi:hypothetical protein
MALEAGAFGPLADKAIDAAINAGQLSGLLELIVSPPEGTQAGADVLLARLTRPENLKGLFASDDVDLSGLDHLLPRLSVEAFEPLFEALCSSPSRTVRRRLLDSLSRTQVDIVPLVVARLNDDRWFVQRNMLMLLTRRGQSAGDVLLSYRGRNTPIRACDRKRSACSSRCRTSATSGSMPLSTIPILASCTWA